MAPPLHRPFADRTYTTTLADISTASSAFCAAAGAGRLIEVIFTLNNAITGADSNLTAEINGAAVSGAAVAAFSGSAQGTSFSIRPTGNNTVQSGDLLEAITDGASSTTCITAVTFIVREF